MRKVSFAWAAATLLCLQGVAQAHSGRVTLARTESIVAASSTTTTTMLITGACCDGSGTCSETTQESCSAAPGFAYQGDATTCADPGLCPVLGACCDSAGCFETTQDLCTFGTYGGDGTTCNDHGICPGLGACCDPFGCSLTNPALCAVMGGAYGGEGTSCLDRGICPGLGACCSPFGCSLTNADLCTGEATYQGNGTSCADPGSCMVVGACCSAGGCSETTQELCTGSYGGDGSRCDPGICSVCGDGCLDPIEVCDDGNTASGDGCDDVCVEEPCYACATLGETTSNAPGGSAGCSGPSMCAPENGRSCDDGDSCTVGDGCADGSCSGANVLIRAACEWVMVGGDPDKNVQARTRGQTQVTGHVCGDTCRIGESSATVGDVVSVIGSGTGVSIGPAAAIDGDVVTDGTVVRGKPHGSILPGLAVDEVGAGMTLVQSGDPGDVYDTTGSNTRTDDCQAAQDDIDDGADLLDALVATDDFGDVLIKGNQSLPIEATNVGGLNVIDFERLRTGNNATLTLDGGGNSATVFVLRIEKKLDIRFQTDLVLAGGTQPGKVIIYGRGKCKFGEEITGGGTVVCPDGKLRMDERAQWDGSLLGGRRKLQLGDAAILTHAPLQVGP